MGSVIVMKKKNKNKKSYDFSWYYMKNIIWGLLFFLFMTVPWNDYGYAISTDDPLYIIILINAFLYPFAKYAIESFVLRYTTQEYWHSGIWKYPSAKNGFVALFYMFCFAVAFPVGLPYAIYRVFIKKE